MHEWVNRWAYERTLLCSMPQMRFRANQLTKLTVVTVQHNFDGCLFIHWAIAYWTWKSQIDWILNARIARQIKYFRCIQASTRNLRCHHYQFQWFFGSKFSAIKRKFTFNPNIRLLCSKFEKKMWMLVHAWNESLYLVWIYTNYLTQSNGICKRSNLKWYCYRFVTVDLVNYKWLFADINVNMPFRIVFSLFYGCVLCVCVECERFKYSITNFNHLPSWNVNKVQSYFGNLPLISAYSVGQTSALYKI